MWLDIMAFKDAAAIDLTTFNMPDLAPADTEDAQTQWPDCQSTAAAQAPVKVLRLRSVQPCMRIFG